MSPEKSAQRPKRSAAEWVAFAIASAILLGVIGAVTSLWLNDDGKPATIESVVSGAPRKDGELHYVLVRVTNRGDHTAESVQVVAELSRDGEVVEEGEQSIDFLAGGETQELQFVFTEDPSTADLAVRAASFAKP